jgi:hypothetical protein
MPKASQRQFLVKATGIDDYFMTKGGGEISSSANKVYDGGRLDPDVISSPAEASDLTLSRAYDPFRDGPILADLRRRVGRFRATISVTPTDEDLVAIGTPAVYSNALLIGVAEPEFDASSGDAATFQLTFSVGAWT